MNPIAKTSGVPMTLRDALRRASYNSIISISSQTIVVIAGVAALYFNSRSLGVVGLGHLAFLLSTATLLEKLFTLQTWQVVGALGEGREGEIFGGALLMDALALLLATGIGLIIASLFAPEGWLLMASIALRLQDPAVGLLRLKNRFAVIAIIDAFQAVAATSVAYLLWKSHAPLSLYLAYAVGLSILFNLLMVGIAWTVTSPKLPSRSAMHEIYRFAVPAGLSSSIGTLRQNAMVPLLGVFAGPIAVGYFTIAEKFASVLVILNSVISQAIFREIKTHVWTLIIVTGGIGLFAAGIFAAALLYAGDQLIQLAAGEEFLPALPVLFILISAGALSLACVGLRAAIIVNESPLAALKCDAVAALTMLPAPILLLAWGAKGAALVYVIYETAWLLASALMLRNFRFWQTQKTQKLGSKSQQ